jgi:hypothetical protein
LPSFAPFLDKIDWAAWKCWFNLNKVMRTIIGPSTSK